MEKRGFLIDMDGVIYKGSSLIDGADQFIGKLLELEIPFLFLTNNSQRTRRDIAKKLQRLGIDVGESHVFTSAMATARFLARQKPEGTAYVIGEGGLLQALHDNGFSIVDSDPDYVVVGEGRTFTLEMAERAIKMIERGSRLIATNMDPNCPTPDGIRAGCGAFAALLERATGIDAFSVGKPSSFMFHAARKEIGTRSADTCMIGDMMTTDVLGGVQMGFRTVLVLSGATRKEDVSRYAFIPDEIVKSIAELDPQAEWQDSGSSAVRTNGSLR